MTDSNATTRVASAVWWTGFLLCAAMLVVHMTAIQLVNMPISPIKLRLANYLDAYVNPYFAQRWNFFAPQPVSRDFTLIARGRRPGSDGRMIETDWIDVTDPLIESVRRNRITPMFLVGLGLSNALVSFENDLASNDTVSFDKDGKKYVHGTLPATLSPMEMMVMRRTAVASLEIANPGPPLSEVQLGVINYEFPRFTERARDATPLDGQTIVIDWQPTGWVVPYCCQKQTQPYGSAQVGNPSFR